MPPQTTVETLEAVDRTTTSGPESADIVADGSPRRNPAALRVSVVLAITLVLALAAGTWVFLAKHDSTIASNKQQTSASVRDAVLGRAAQAAVKAYTVTAANHAADNAAAAVFMTPRMAAKYTGQISAAQWKTLTAGGAKQAAKVVADGVTSMTKDVADVFALVVVTTTAKNTSSNSVVAYRLNLTLVRQNGAWLVDDMNVIF